MQSVGIDVIIIYIIGFQSATGTGCRGAEGVTEPFNQAKPKDITIIDCLRAIAISTDNENRDESRNREIWGPFDAFSFA